MKFNVKEIAKESGVSIATVSRILNNKGGHSGDAVKAVESAMDRLGIRNANHVQLPEAVGIITRFEKNGLATSYTSILISAIVETLAMEGVVAQIIPLSVSNMSVQYIRDVGELYNLKGFIVIEFSDLYSISEKLAALSIPVVGIGNTDGLNLPNYVSGDNRKGAEELAEYLWSMGHRKFGIMSLSKKDICQRMRVNGFVETLKAKGASDADIWQKEFMSIDDSAVIAASEIVNMKKRPTVIVSTISTIIRKLIVEMMRFGIRIPDDISLAAFENHRELEDCYPPVTAMGQPVREMGEAAASLLISLVRKIKSPDHFIIPCRFIVRDTVRKISV